MKFPWIALAVAPDVSQTPYPKLPEITLPAPATEPPIVLADAPETIATPAPSSSR